MTFLRPKTSRFRMLAVLALAGATLSACSPTPEPTPTPTAAFASEEEAFAAAEETYRAYNDALNQQRNGDQSADPMEFLTGEILNSEMTAARKLEETGVSIVGDTKVTSFTGVGSHLGSIAEINASVCLDISNARAIDIDGQDVTASDRSDLYAVSVTFTGTPEELLIGKYEVDPDIQC